MVFFAPRRGQVLPLVTRPVTGPILQYGGTPTEGTPATAAGRVFGRVSKLMAGASPPALPGRTVAEGGVERPRTYSP